MTSSGEVIDLLVLGAGMAGLSAAAKAASDGASVVLVEKGEAIGGSAVYAGFIWTAPTVEVMREVNPDGDPALGRRIVEGYDDALAFVRSLGVHVADPVTVLGYGRGCATDMANFLLACDRLVRERGEVLVRSHALRLLTEDGAVVGAEIETPAGTRTDSRAQHAARHRRLRRRSRPARRAHRARGEGHPAAREPQQHRRRPAPRPGRGRGHGRAQRRLLRPPDPVRSRLHEPVRVHGPDLLPLRARGAAQPQRAALLRRDDRRSPEHAARARSARRAGAADHRPARARAVDARALRRRRRADRQVPARVQARRAGGDRRGHRGARLPARGMGLRRRSRARHAARVQPPVRGGRARARTPARPRAARDRPVLRDRGHPRDHLHLHRPADRRARARARRRRRADPRAAGRRRRRRRRVPSRLRRRPRGGAGVRPAGRRHRYASSTRVSRANLSRRDRWEHWTAKSPSSRARAAARAARTRSSSPRRARTSSRSTSATTRSARSATRWRRPTISTRRSRASRRSDRRAVKGVADVRDLDQVIAVVEQGLAELGRIDVVCANAGIGSWAVAWEMTAEQWKDMIDINLTGVFNAARAALPSMVARGEGGSVILTSSTAGLDRLRQHRALHRGQARRDRPDEGARAGGRAARHPRQRDLPDDGQHAAGHQRGTFQLFAPHLENPGPRRRARRVLGPEHPPRRAVDRAVRRVRHGGLPGLRRRASTSPASRCRSTPATSSRRDSE